MSPLSAFQLVLSLSLRNLLRNTKRTIITGAAVVAGTAVLILGDGFVGGLDENVIRAQEDAVAGHVILRPEGYPTDGLTWPLDEAVVPSPALEAALSGPEAGAVVAVAPRVFASARLIFGADAVRVRLLGYDPVADPAVFPVADWPIEGAWPKPGADELVLGAEVASLTGAKPGSTVVIEARTKPGAINALSYTVSGVVRSSNPAIDGLVLLPMAAADALLLTEGSRSALSLRLRGRGDAEREAARLSQAGWVATTAAYEARDLIAINLIRRRAIGFIVSILLLIAGLGIANTIIMSTYERVREIGTLRALGMSSGALRGLFLLEGVFLGLGAGLAGALIGGGIVYYYSVHGIDLSAAAKGQGDFAFSTMLYLSFGWSAIGRAITFSLGISLIASVYPAIRAASLNPADAVRAD